MELQEARSPPIKFVQELGKTDLEDVHVIRRETAERVLTRERERLLQEIQRGDVESVRDLARRVDRNVSIVSRDLDVLFEADIVDFEVEGRSKKPNLAHENVIVEPIVFDGEVRARAE